MKQIQALPVSAGALLSCLKVVELVSRCPYPGKCIYDDFQKCGVHFCTLPICAYSARSIEAITDEILRVVADGRPGWESKYAALEAERKKLLRSR